MKTKKQIGMLYGAIALIVITSLYLGAVALISIIDKTSTNAGRSTRVFYDRLVETHDTATFDLVRGVEAKEKEYAYNDQISINVVREEIIKQAKLYGNDVQFMLDLADCESDFNNLSENTVSSAEGVYQYLYGTWRETESGKQHKSRFDYKSNILEANRDIANEEYFRWSECL